jgi:hypothetical protein
MELQTVPTYDVVHTGSDEFEISAGQSLKIETSPEGDEILNAECPAGKVWYASVRIDIKEKNV